MPPIIEELKDKRVAIMGFGREGKSIYNYIRKYLPEKPLTIVDERVIEDEHLSHVSFHCGKDYQYVTGFDIIMKSPGIVLEDDVDQTYMNSMTNLFLKHYGKQTIGITGTKGKSTTSSLLYHILQENKKHVVFLGNIGKPAFDMVDEITIDTTVVFELSCHQLEYVEYAPHIGVLLNIYEEHLDHYGTFEKYIHAKENIWRNQQEHDILLCEKELIQDCMVSHVVSVSMEDPSADIYACLHDVIMHHQSIHFDPLKNPLLGHHNMFDIAVDVYIANTYFAISIDSCLEALKSFTPLPHRLQYVGKYHDIHWYDDSISTICETTIQALKTLPQTTTLLVGGMDRGIDYTPLATYLQKHPVANLIVMPDSGEVIADLLPNASLYHALDLQDAVAIARKVTCMNGIVVLSPAAASYGFFKNFEDRGEQYQSFLKEE